MGSVGGSPERDRRTESLANWMAPLLAEARLSPPIAIDDDGKRR